jgi:hypothetical protein
MIILHILSLSLSKMKLHGLSLLWMLLKIEAQQRNVQPFIQQLLCYFYRYRPLYNV